MDVRFRYSDVDLFEFSSNLVLVISAVLRCSCGSVVNALDVYSADVV